MCFIVKIVAYKNNFMWTSHKYFLRFFAHRHLSSYFNHLSINNYSHPTCYYYDFLVVSFYMMKLFLACNRNRRKHNNSNIKLDVPDALGIDKWQTNKRRKMFLLSCRYDFLCRIYAVYTDNIHKNIQMRQKRAHNIDIRLAFIFLDICFCPCTRILIMMWTIKCLLWCARRGHVGFSYKENIYDGFLRAESGSGFFIYMERSKQQSNAGEVL